jgi:hypothetical protein
VQNVNAVLFKTWQKAEEMLVTAYGRRSCVVFFDMEGIVHSEFVPPMSMVNSAFYKEVLQHLREDIGQKR